MADWIDTQFPHWLEARVQERDPTQAIMAAMQFGANQRQRNFDNALKLKTLEVQEQSRALQNRLLEMRIDTDSADAATLAEWLPKFNAAQGDELRNLPLPALRDVGRLDGIQRMITGRIAADANTTAGRIAATTRDSFLKEVETLDPQWRGDALSYLDDNQGIPTNDAWDYVDYAKKQSLARAEADKLRVAESQQKMIESRQIAVEQVKNLYRAGLRGATSITDKAKLSAFNNELHQITFDPLLSTEEKESKQRAVLAKFGVTPNFQESGANAPAAEFEGEENLYDQEIANVQREIEKNKIDLAKKPGKPLMDFGKDNRLIKIEELEQQKTALQNAKKNQPATALPTDRIRVRSKDGKIGSVPRSQLEQAQKEGYSIVE